MTAFTHERYEAQAPVGQGATVAVWQVLDRQDGATRSMKILEAAATFADRLAFLGDYQALRRLAHPRWAAAHDAGTLADGRPFYIVEAKPGPAVADFLALSPARVLTQLGEPTGDAEQAAILTVVGQAAIALGRPAEALEALDEAVRLAGAQEHGRLTGYARSLRALALADAGRLAEALADAEAAVAAGRGLPYLEAAARAFQSAVRLTAGDAAGALDTAYEGRALARPLADPELDTLLAMACAEGLLASGGGAHAVRYLDSLHRKATIVEARAGLLAALAAYGRRDFALAIRAGETAERTAVRAGLAPLMHALVLLEGSAEAAEGRNREAASHFRRAHAEAQAQGLVMLAADAVGRLATVEDAPEVKRLLEASRAQLAAIAETLPAQARHTFEQKWLPAPAAPASAPVSADAEALSVISDFGRMVTGTLRYDEVLDKVIDQVMALAGAERGMIMLVDPDGAMTGVVVRPRDAAGEEGLMAFSGTFVQAALEARQPIWITDAQGDERFSASASVMALDLRTVLCVPLIVEGEVIGLLYVDRQSVIENFTEADLRLVEGLAGFAALSIVNARRYEEARAHAEELAAAQALSSLAGGRLGLGEVIQAIAAGVTAVLPAERLVVLLGEDPYPTLAFDAAGAPADPQVASAIVERVVASREVIAERDAADPVAGAARQVLAAPLVVGDELLGALYLVRAEDGRPFTPREIGLLEMLVAHAAPSLDAVATREGLSRHVERLEGLVGTMQVRLVSQADGEPVDFGEL